MYVLQLCLTGHEINFTLRSTPAGVDGRIILKWILKSRKEGVEWIDLARCINKWWAHVNAAMSLWVA